MKRKDPIVIMSNTNLLLTILNNQAQVNRAANDLSSTRLYMEQNKLLLSSTEGSFTPVGLLNSLSETKLKTEAYYQPGFYIAEINESGYLGAVLFKVKTT